MSDVKCTACGSIGAILIACSKCKKITYCKVCEPELDFERVEKRLCETCFQNFIKEKETKEFEKEIIDTFQVLSESFEKTKKEQSEEKRALLESTDFAKQNAVLAVICTVIGSLVLLRDPNETMGYCSLLFVPLFIAGFFAERKETAKRVTQLNMIKSEKRFSDYTEKEKHEWIYDGVVSSFTYWWNYGGDLEDENGDLGVSDEDKWEYEMIKIRIKKVIESLKLFQ